MEQLVRMVLVTGACLGALPYTLTLSGWWRWPPPVPIAVLLVTVAHAASRVRGVCRGRVDRAMPHRDRVVLCGPAAPLILASAAASKFAFSPPIVAGALLFAGTGLMLSARAASW